MLIVAVKPAWGSNGRWCQRCISHYCCWCGNLRLILNLLLCLISLIVKNYIGPKFKMKVLKLKLLGLPSLCFIILKTVTNCKLNWHCRLNNHTANYETRSIIMVTSFSAKYVNELFLWNRCQHMWQCEKKST